MAVLFCVCSWSYTNSEKKTQESDKLYRLWFVLDLTGSVYSAFCSCKHGSDQGCRHLGATLFEPDDFFQIKESLSPLCPHIGTPSQHPHSNLSLCLK